MERDFMGLKNKEPLMVKQEAISDASKARGSAMAIGMQWPFFNKVSAVPHVLPFKQDMRSGHRYHDIVNPQLLRGFPVSAPQAVPPTVHSAGATNSCSIGSAAPAQLTIFYAGKVNVFETISPEKAQAIMFLAGSSVPRSSYMGHPYAEASAPNSNRPALDFPPVNQTITPPPPCCSRLSSPLSISSHNGVQSRSGSTSTEELIARTKEVATTSASRLELASITSPLGTVSAVALIPSGSLVALPQARKASLARFLEKRKERVRNAAPYNLNKNCLELFAGSSKE